MIQKHTSKLPNNRIHETDEYIINKEYCRQKKQGTRQDNKQQHKSDTNRKADAPGGKKEKSSLQRGEKMRKKRE